jgi:ankyrin repeat protein
MLKKALTRLPPTLDETYERILAGINDDYSIYALRILQWLTFSARPLSIEEVAETIAVDGKRDPVFDPEEVLEDPYDAHVICPSLITMNTHDEHVRGKPTRHVVALAHFSIKDYLVSDRVGLGRAAGYSMQDAASHGAIATCCLGYLLQLQQPELTVDDVESFKLARYSAEFWSSHAQKALEQTKEISQIALRLCSKENPAYLNWIRLFDPEQPSKGPNLRKSAEEVQAPLYYATCLDLEDVVKLLIEDGADVNTQGGRYSSSLQAASAQGHEQIVKLLLMNNADVNAQGGEHGNALCAASARGHEQIVKLLLMNGADVNTQGGRYSSSLQAASAQGHEQIVKLLLMNNADVNTQGGRYSSSLQAASAQGHEQIVKLLLMNNADVNAQGGEHGNALCAASARGHEQIVKLLLNNGAIVKASSKDAPTDSGYASQRWEDDHEQDLHVNRESKMTITNSYDVEFELEDIRSVESDQESIGSMVPTNRSNVELLAVQHLASFFAQLKNLRPLHEIALRKINQGRFTRNYRKILKWYCRRLLQEATSSTEKDIVNVLRSRRNRENIAQGITNHVVWIDEEESRPLGKMFKQTSEKEYLEIWLSKMQDPDSHQLFETEHEPTMDSYSSQESDYESDTDSDSEAEHVPDTREFINIHRAESFLQRGSAFRNLILDIRLLILPGPLREIFESTPKDLIELSSKNDTSCMNKMKAFLEEYTGFEWDWWPLVPRVPDLEFGQQRLQWKVGDLCSFPSLHTTY